MREIRKRTVSWGVAALVVALIAGELFARYGLGLGSPPLLITHPTIEYLFKPNQDVYRFHNHFVVNSYGMRSGPLSAKKAPAELRLLVFGDSIVNGGSRTDQTDLATTLLETRLASDARKPVRVGNVSAGSWGPGNWLAYAQEYGFFDADVVALVISSHDYVDNPTFTSIDKKEDPSTERPVSALVEGITRYLPRYLGRSGSDGGASETVLPAAVTEQQAQRALRDLSQFLRLAQMQAKTVMVFQHLERSEIANGSPNPGYQRIREVCQHTGITPVSLEAWYRRSLQEGVNPYRDNIHPNEAGQKLIAEAIMASLVPVLHDE